MEGNDVIEFFFQFPYFAYCDLNVGSLAADSATWLMHHDTAVFKCCTFSLRACTHQYSSHRCCHTNTDSGHIWCDVLHSVINAKAGIYTTTGAVDVHLDIPRSVSTFKK